MSQSMEERISELIGIIPNKHMLVLDLMLSGMKNDAAYMAIYPSVKKKHTASQSVSRLLKNVDYIEYLDLRKRVVSASAAEQLGINELAVLRELKLLGFSNMKNLYDENGNQIPISELPMDVAACIQVTKARREATKSTAEDGDVEVETHITELKLYDKKTALIQLGKAIGMFQDKVEVDASDPLKDMLERIGDRNMERSPLPSGN